MYFKVLSIAWGVLLMFQGPGMVLLGRRWTRFEFKGIYPEKQPFRAWAVSVVGLILIAVTWWMQLKHPAACSWIATVVVTLTAVKLSQLLFNYRRFRAFGVRLTEKRPRVVAVLNAGVGALGLVLVLLGIFVY